MAGRALVPTHLAQEMDQGTKTVLLLVTWGIYHHIVLLCVKVKVFLGLLVPLDPYLREVSAVYTSVFPFP